MDEVRKALADYLDVNSTPSSALASCYTALPYLPKQRECTELPQSTVPCSARLWMHLGLPDATC